MCGVAPAAAEDPAPELWPEGGHIRVLNPGDISGEEAEKIYLAIVDRMIAGYERSGVHGLNYREWRRFNTHPYVSDQHGARLVNVYGNDLADRLLTATKEEPIAPGAKVIKDSISVADTGGVARGPLFMMEKMQAGFDPENGDWRYTMIMPNGKLFGSTGGQGSASVKFCAECHLQAESRDFLFELPEEFLATETE
jgi:hypothetical protein